MCKFVDKLPVKTKKVKQQKRYFLVKSKLLKASAAVWCIAFGTDLLKAFAEVYSIVSGSDLFESI